MQQKSPTKREEPAERKLFTAPGKRPRFSVHFPPNSVQSRETLPSSEDSTNNPSRCVCVWGRAFLLRHFFVRLTKRSQNHILQTLLEHLQRAHTRDGPWFWFVRKLLLLLLLGLSLPGLFPRKKEAHQRPGWRCCRFIGPWLPDGVGLVFLPKRLSLPCPSKCHC